MLFNYIVLSFKCFKFWFLLKMFDIAIEILVICVSLFTIICSLMLYILSKQRHDSSFLLMLDEALENNDVTSCILLLKKYPYLANNSFKDGYTPFLRACLFGNTQVVKYMLDFCKVDIRKCTSNKESAFYLAVYERIKNKSSRDASCIHTLYHANADINAATVHGYSPIQLAAMFGHTSLVRWLLTKNVNMNVFPSPYILAKSQGHHDTAMVLKNANLKAIE
ncbi:ankyrin repeat domain-containing protein 53-like [Agrilus planipennis]|uniref:Ankyrin repeat domain-containing protein 53-like n=1 Tax=Agrilus planipennis TaxID=224129 RepID=A0A1W4WQ75_AGRPL|nr:ankyrin repeat domain-containing protein 53-like [Agrilus planipennis]